MLIPEDFKQKVSRAYLRKIFPTRKQIPKTDTKSTIPLGTYNEQVLHLAPEGINVVNPNDANQPWELVHISIFKIDKNYLFYRKKDEIFPRIKELDDLMPNLDFWRIKEHYDRLSIKYIPKKETSSKKYFLK